MEFEALMRNLDNAVRYILRLCLHFRFRLCTHEQARDVYIVAGLSYWVRLQTAAGQGGAAQTKGRTG